MFCSRSCAILSPDRGSPVCVLNAEPSAVIILAVPLLRLVGVDDEEAMEVCGQGWRRRLSTHASPPYFLLWNPRPGVASFIFMALVQLELDQSLALPKGLQQLKAVIVRYTQFFLQIFYRLAWTYTQQDQETLKRQIEMIPNG